MTSRVQSVLPWAIVLLLASLGDVEAKGGGGRGGGGRGGSGLGGGGSDECYDDAGNQIDCPGLSTKVIIIISVVVGVIVLGLLLTLFLFRKKIKGAIATFKARKANKETGDTLPTYTQSNGPAGYGEKAPDNELYAPPPPAPAANGGNPLYSAPTGPPPTHGV